MSARPYRPAVPDLRLFGGGEITVGPEWMPSSDVPYRSLDHILYHVLDGGCEVEADGVWHHLRAGGFYFLLGHHWHRRRISGTMRKRYLHFRCERLSSDLRLATAGTIISLPPAAHQPWIAAMARVGPLMQARHAGTADLAQADAWVVEGMVLQAVGMQLARLGPAADGDDRDPHLRRAVAYLDTAYLRRPGLAAVARAAGCSARHLQARFAAALSCSPAAYAHARRMQDAEHLLSTTNLAVQDVARRCGYDDPLHFSRLVRRHFGDSPRRLRARRQSGDG